MSFDKEKLIKMLAYGHELNKKHLDQAIMVMQRLDSIPEDWDFDITEMENEAVGELISTESARVAKLVGNCHSRGEQWIQKWNERVLGGTPEQEEQRNNDILKKRSKTKQPAKKPGKAEVAAGNLLDDTLKKLSGA